MIMNGALAGLVGITASAHIMTPVAAAGIGSIAAVVMYGVATLLEKLEIDDVVGAVPVHLSAGIWGTLAVAIFADPEAWGTGLGRWDQLVVQVTGVGATFVWAFGLGFILLWLINRVYPLRIDPEGERVGLNVSEHGASTEILDLLTEMAAQRRVDDFLQPVNVEPHTEIGQIAQQYNHVIAGINAEQRRREAATEALRLKTVSLQLVQGAAAAANQAWGTGLGRWDQLVVQVTGVGATFVWAFGLGFILLWLINRVYPLRIDPEGERVGLNVSEHGASTEILDLLTEMAAQRRVDDFLQPVNVEPHTEIGQIAQQYNHVIAGINAEQRRREAATEALRLKTVSLQLVQGAAAAANQAATIEDAVKTCLKDICAFGGWAVGHCYMLEEAAGKLVSSKIWHLDDAERFAAFRQVTEATTFESGVGLPGRVMASGDPAWVVDVSQDPSLRRGDETEDLGVKGGAAFPVLVGKDVAAVLEFYATEAVEPNKAMLEVMASVGTQLGRVVERGRSEATRFRSVLDNMPAAAFLKSLDGRFRLINRKYEELYGVTFDSVRGKTVYDIYPKELADECTQLDRETIDAEGVIEREVMVEQDGRDHFLTTVMFPVFDEQGAMTAFGGIEVDITERKVAEAKLLEGEERLKLALKGGDLGFWDINFETGSMIANERWAEMLGYSLDEVDDHRDVALAHFHPDDRERVKDYNRRSTEGEITNYEIEYRVITKQGETRWQLSKADTVEHNERGEPRRIVGTVMDITERKQAEEELARKEAQLRVALDNTPGGIRFVDGDGNYVLFNARYLELYDFPEGLLKVGEHYRVENLYQAQRGDFGPGDPEALTDEWLASRPRHTEPQRWERTTAAGKVLDVWTAPTPAGGYVNVVTDITERKRAEEARRESQELLQTILDHMPAPVYLRDVDGRFMLVNRSYEDIHRVTKDDVIGKTLDEVFSKERAVEFGASDPEIVEQCRVVGGEERHQLPDGEHILAVMKFPILDPSGEVVAVGGVDMDITERKRAEEELQKAYGIIKDQKDRMEDELNIGREIQMSMIPLRFPAFPDRDEFSISATLEPAREVGGDFYDYYFLDEEQLCFCIGDVSGKGVPAALFMAMAKTLIKSRAADDRSTASILTHVNDELSADNPRSMFVTIFSGILNVNTGELKYTNAGHNPSYVRRENGTLQQLGKRHGPAIGAMEGMVYAEESVILEPGDLLFLYTDGVTEAMDIDHHLFSDDRLKELLASLDTGDAGAAVGLTVAAVRTFEGAAEQADDITVVGLRFQGKPEDTPMVEHRVTIKNRLPEIAAVNEAFEAFAKEFGIPATTVMKFNIIFDDLLNNIVTYGYRDDEEHDIEVRMDLTGDRLTVTITDDGVPFNPLNAKPPDIDAPLEERQIGGLGIHLARSLIDDATYQRRIGKNAITLMKHLEQENRVS